MNIHKANRAITYANLMERMRKIMEHISTCRRCMHTDKRKFNRLQEEIFHQLQHAHGEIQQLAVHDEVMPAEWLKDK